MNKIRKFILHIPYRGIGSDVFDFVMESVQMFDVNDMGMV